MKTFKLTQRGSSESHGPMPESVAMQCLYDQQDMASLRNLGAGEYMRDAHGDLWERVE